MGIHMHNNGTIGCAYYSALDEILYLQEDIPLAGTDLIETLLVHARPTTVLVPNRVPEALIEYLERGTQRTEDAEVESEFRSAYILRPVVTVDFSYRSGRDRLVGLDLNLFRDGGMRIASAVGDDGDGQGPSVRNKLMKLSGFINLDSQFSIGCAGAVVSEIKRRRATEYLRDDPNAAARFRIKEIEMFTLADSMFVNADTLASLQILRSENHPNSQMQGQSKSNYGAKENLPVYGIIQSFACTPQGKKKLRQIFIRPSTDLELIEERQKTIEVLLRPENCQALTSIVKMLRKIQNIRTPLLLLHNGVDNSSQKKDIRASVWAALSRFARFAVELGACIRSLTGAESIRIISKVTISTFHLADQTSKHITKWYNAQKEIARVGAMIHATVDFHELDLQRTMVLHGVDRELDDLKRTYAGLASFLTETSAKVARRIPEWAQMHTTCTYLPQIGFLVRVKLDPLTGRSYYDGQDLADDLWVAQFTSDGYIYYKTRMMRDLDKEIGDLCRLITGKYRDIPKSAEEDADSMFLERQIDILRHLGVEVLKYEDTLTTASDLYGDFDNLLALALGAQQYGWTVPRMTASNLINIVGVRHPLQELVVPSFIANDCKLTGGPGSRQSKGEEAAAAGPSMLVLTGPNHSGKNVYLKQVALIVYLAHIGSYVPAKSASIGLTDRILTRISTRESVSRNESAFVIDLRQAAFSMNFATRQSLILIDEFGKGTNARDGAGLVTALLDHFLSLGNNRPKVLAATHFHEIFECGFLSESEELAFAHMEVHVDHDAVDMDDQVTYLFRLVPGRSISSLGTKCAAMNGIGRAVLERAETLTGVLARNEDLRAACAGLSKDEQILLESAEVAARRFVERDIPNPASRKLELPTPRLVRDEDEPMRNILREVLSPADGEEANSFITLLTICCTLVGCRQGPTFHMSFMIV